VLNLLAQKLPWLLGGSADLAPSNRKALTYEGASSFQAGDHGRQETALPHPRTRNGRGRERVVVVQAPRVRLDYSRTAIRLSVLMELPRIYMFTHDAMGDGEDGPTHQPVEHLASLRAIPGLVTLRPGDANEVVEAPSRRDAAAPRGGVARVVAAGPPVGDANQISESAVYVANREVLSYCAPI